MNSLSHDPSPQLEELKDAYFSLKTRAQAHQDDFSSFLELGDLQAAGELSDSLSSELQQFRTREKSSRVELPNGESILLAEDLALRALEELGGLLKNELSSRVFAIDGRLSSLDLSNLQLRDISPLSSCTALETLLLNGNSEPDLSPLVSCQELTVLTLDDSAVHDLSPLQHCPKLTDLYLSRTPVSDLSPLAHCSKLEWVTLSNTSVTDLSPLTALSSLRRIGIEGLSIPEEDPARTKLREQGVEGA